MDGITATTMVGEPVVFEREGKVFANSRDVATFFDKNHQHVMRDIRKLISLRPELNRSNFGLVELPDGKGELRPAYDMDRDGFTLLAMGFTGEKALDFKLRYIAAFNAMEEALRHQPHATIEPPPHPEHREFPEWPLEEMRTKGQMVNLYRLTYGPPCGQWVMPILGFPVPPKNLITEGRLPLFETETFASVTTITRGMKEAAE